MHWPNSEWLSVKICVVQKPNSTVSPEDRRPAHLLSYMASGLRGRAALSCGVRTQTGGGAAAIRRVLAQFLWRREGLGITLGLLMLPIENGAQNSAAFLCPAVSVWQQRQGREVPLPGPREPGARVPGAVSRAVPAEEQLGAGTALWVFLLIVHLFETC